MGKNHVFSDSDITCIGCGQNISVSLWGKRKERNRQDWRKCGDCTATQTNKITVHHPVLGLIQCHPHLGDVNELWQPLDDKGNLYRPGKRLCGHKDCVNTAHVEPVVAPLPDHEVILLSNNIDLDAGRVFDEQAV
jgi:hypothetical protein